MRDFGYIKENYLALSLDIKERAKKAGREVTLVAVTKSADDEELMALAECGIPDIGENRPGELARRGELLFNAGYTPRLHEIGKLQRNKVRLIIERAELIHSVDTVQLGREINRLATARGKIQRVLIEVNSAREPNKSGALPEDVEALMLELKKMPSLSVCGLMTMGPLTPSPEDIRPYFRLTKELFDRLSEKYGFEGEGILSMGMSDSYAVAIEEGATLVRVGSRLFEKTKGENTDV